LLIPYYSVTGLTKRAMGASQFRKRHSERSDSEVKNPDLAQGLRSFAILRSAQDDKSGMHPRAIAI